MKDLYLKVVCTVKVMMRIFLSESMCKKLCVNIVFASYDFPKKKNWEEKTFRKRNGICCRRSRASWAPGVRVQNSRARGKEVTGKGRGEEEGRRCGKGGERERGKEGGTMVNNIIVGS